METTKQKAIRLMRETLDRERPVDPARIEELVDALVDYALSGERPTEHERAVQQLRRGEADPRD